MRYASVRLGKLNSNAPAEYPFPTTKAAKKFAKSHHAMYPERVIIVKDSFGKTVQQWKPRNLKKKDAAR